MNNPKYAEYYRPYDNDFYTVKGTLDYGGYFGRMHPKMRHIMLVELNTSGRLVLDGILTILTEKPKEECEKLIGTQGYRYIIFSTQKNLSTILKLDSSVVSRGLDNLEAHGIIKRKIGGAIIINPLVYCKDSTYDIRCLEEFKLEFVENKKDTKKSKSNKDGETVSRKKQDMSKVVPIAF